jgi:hypothetical protein
MKLKDIVTAAVFVVGFPFDTSYIGILGRYLRILLPRAIF